MSARQWATPGGPQALEDRPERRTVIAAKVTDLVAAEADGDGVGLGGLSSSGVRDQMIGDD